MRLLLLLLLVTAPAWAQQARPMTIMPKVDIPAEARRDGLTTTVRVEVTVRVDGTVVPRLLTSTGNAQVDANVLQAVRGWKWEPAYKDGQPLESVTRLKVEIVVD